VPGSVHPASSFAVLESPRSSDDVLPTDIAASLSRSVQPEFSSADIQAARRVLANKPGWLVPTVNEELCLVDVVYPLIARVGGTVLPPSLTESCAPEAAARDGEIVETQSMSATNGDARPIRLIGVAPNHVETVTVITSNGEHLVADVIRNAYEVVVRDPVAVKLRVRADGHLYTHTIHVSVARGRYAGAPSG
jgi:hypothetical protein